MAAYRRVYEIMTHVTRRLTAKNREQLRNPTLGSRVRAFYPHSRAARRAAVRRAAIDPEVASDSG